MGRDHGRVGEVGRYFLRLGATAFGGPAAHLGLMQQELVERRKWLTQEEFLDLVGSCNLLPGPSSSQVAMAIGYRRAGLAGLVTAGGCFLLPSFGATLGLAWGYVRYGSLPEVGGLLWGVRPVILAILAQAVWNLRRAALPGKQLGWATPILAVTSLVAALAGAPAVAILAVAAAAGVAVRQVTSGNGGRLAAMGWMLPGSVAATKSTGLAAVGLAFLKLGVVVFGSGYVLVAFLKADLVDRLHWITMAQLLDAVTAGQVTPGPVFTTATFVGYLLHGFAGAMVATAAVFLPSFVMVAGVGWVAPRLRKSVAASAALDGVNAAALALMASVLATLSRAVLGDVMPGVAGTIGVVCLAVLLKTRLNPTWLIGAGAVAGWVLMRVQPGW